MREDFNNYMEEFRKLPLDEKKEIAIEQLKLFVGLTDTMCKQLEIPSELLINKDAIEYKNSEADFVEAVVVYINSGMNYLYDAVDKISDLLEKSVND